MQINEQDEHNALDLLRAVYRNPDVALPTRMRAAMAASPFEVLSSRLSLPWMPGDFAAKLDQAIKRSRQVKPMIETKPITNITANVSAKSDTTRPVTNGDRKPTIIDRRFRRW